MNTPHLVLRAIRSLQQQGSKATLRTLLAVVPAPPLHVAASLKTLEADGYLDLSPLRAQRTDRDRLGSVRLTMKGFVASHVPSVVAYERRSAPRTQTEGEARTRVA